MNIDQHLGLPLVAKTEQMGKEFWILMWKEKHFKFQSKIPKSISKSHKFTDSHIKKQNIPHTIYLPGTSVSYNFVSKIIHEYAKQKKYLTRGFKAKTSCNITHTPYMCGVF